VPLVSACFERVGRNEDVPSTRPSRSSSRSHGRTAGTLPQHQPRPRTAAARRPTFRRVRERDRTLAGGVADRVEVDAERDDADARRARLARDEEREPGHEQEEAHERERDEEERPPPEAVDREEAREREQETARASACRSPPEHTGGSALERAEADAGRDRGHVREARVRKHGARVVRDRVHAAELLAEHDHERRVRRAPVAADREQLAQQVAPGLLAALDVEQRRHLEEVARGEEPVLAQAQQRRVRGAVPALAEQPARRLRAEEDLDEQHERGDARRRQPARSRGSARGRGGGHASARIRT
jgi:hypothetical protein